jgi:shikimate dehydrogenase
MTGWGIQSKSFLVGLIGAGIQASLSPAMHERAGARHGFQYVYRKIDLDVLGVGVDALPQLLNEAERQGFSGLNITYPCKQAVIAHLHELSADAAAIGAVNTVVFNAGRRVGHNTDCSGFALSFRASLKAERRERVVQLGAGGAGAAVAHAALGEGVKCLVLVDPDSAKAQALSTALCERFGEGRSVVGEDLVMEMDRADGLIHATPTGMLKHPGLPLSAALLKPAHWVAEIVYFPLETELLRVARRLGCRAVDGSGMAVFQAVGAFELFTGVEPDSAQMRRDFDALIRQDSRSM